MKITESDILGLLGLKVDQKFELEISSGKFRDVIVKIDEKGYYIEQSDGSPLWGGVSCLIGKDVFPKLTQELTTIEKAIVQTIINEGHETIAKDSNGNIWLDRTDVMTGIQIPLLNNLFHFIRNDTWVCVDDLRKSL